MAPAVLHDLRKHFPGLDREHSVCYGSLTAVGFFESGTETFVPAVKNDRRVVVVMIVGEIEFMAHIIAEGIEKRSVAGIEVIIDQTLHPIQRIAENAVILIGGIENVLFDKVIVAECDQGGSLGGVGIAGP